MSVDPTQQGTLIGNPSFPDNLKVEVYNLLPVETIVRCLRVNTGFRNFIFSIKDLRQRVNRAWAIATVRAIPERWKRGLILLELARSGQFLPHQVETMLQEVQQISIDMREFGSPNSVFTLRASFDLQGAKDYLHTMRGHPFYPAGAVPVIKEEMRQNLILQAYQTASTIEEPYGRAFAFVEIAKAQCGPVPQDLGPTSIMYLPSVRIALAEENLKRLEDSNDRDSLLFDVVKLKIANQCPDVLASMQLIKHSDVYSLAHIEIMKASNSAPETMLSTLKSMKDPDIREIGLLEAVKLEAPINLEQAKLSAILITDPDVAEKARLEIMKVEAKSNLGQAKMTALSFLEPLIFADALIEIVKL